MTIATWNVNSVRARLERLLRWLGEHRPNVLCIQELKVVDEAFPSDALLEAGYHSAVYGQKTYNGVAILSRAEPKNVQRGITKDLEDPQARLLSAEIAGVRVLSAYVPNGQVVGSEKYRYKLDWLARLRQHLDCHFSPEDPVVLCGDTNVARDDLDVARPEEWGNSVLCHQDARDALERVRQWGFTDVFRERHPDGGLYSWWDYRMGAFPRNNGLRIDHIFATEPLASRCTRADVDREERTGPKPSDHAPVIAVFEG